MKLLCPKTSLALRVLGVGFLDRHSKHRRVVYESGAEGRWVARTGGLLNAYLELGVGGHFQAADMRSSLRTQDNGVWMEP